MHLAYSGVEFRNVIFQSDILVEILRHLKPNEFKGLPRDLLNLRCTSKVFEKECSKAIKAWEDKRSLLLGDVAIMNEWNIRDAETAIDFIIGNKLEVANLKSCRNISEMHLERLFKKAPNIKHLILCSNHIKNLPDLCHRLQTLECIYCESLEKLPSHMPEITYLDYRGCTALKQLPVMPNLTTSYF